MFATETQLNFVPLGIYTLFVPVTLKSLIQKIVKIYWKSKLNQEGETNSNEQDSPISHGLSAWKYM